MPSNNTMPLDTVISASPDQVACDLDEEIVILNLKDGVYYGLNPIAARVWRIVQEPRKVEEIRDMLLWEFDVDKEQCTQDLIELIGQLMEWKLVEARNGRREI
jgi:hypothetical protein